MKRVFTIGLVATCLVLTGTGLAQSPVLRFYASPYRVYQGDAVRFIYLDRTNGVPVPGVIPRWRAPGYGRRWQTRAKRGPERMSPKAASA